MKKHLYVIVIAAWQLCPRQFKHFIANSQILNRIKILAKRKIEHTADYSQIYDNQFYSSLQTQKLHSASVMAKSIVDVFHPKTVIDVGCGSGLLLNELHKYAVDVFGLDNSFEAISRCKELGLNVEKYDMRKPEASLNSKKYDLVMSLEVAEHLPEKYADDYIAFLAIRGDVVLFSAATPGQGGQNHVNEKPHRYWVEKFADEKFIKDQELTDRLRKVWKDGGVLSWYAKNILVFKKR